APPHHGSAGGGQGHPGGARRATLRDPGRLDGRHLPRHEDRGHPAGPAGPRHHGLRRLRQRRDHQRDRRRPVGRGGLRPGLPARRLPAHPRPGGDARRLPGRPRRGARRRPLPGRRRGRGGRAAAQARRDRRSGRRPRGDHPRPPAGLRRPDGAPARDLPPPRPAGRGRRPGARRPGLPAPVRRAGRQDRRRAGPQHRGL
ncbi:MAG: Adenylate kinase, partial [uncultured Friedmanniella sp.]